MSRSHAVSLALLALLAGAASSPLAAQQTSGRGPALTPDRLELRNVKADTVEYEGRRAIRLIDVAPPDLGDAGRLAILRGTSFDDGTIEIAVSGNTAPDAPPFMRGFVGVAFRVAPDGSRFECFYLRPKNGRSPDPVQRSHSTQYISLPGYPWQKLRAETPGKYESYVDLVPGEWIRVRIVVSGQRAQLFVNGAAQPALVVDDLKQPRASGAIALWVGPGTIAHFAGLTVTP